MHPCATKRHVHGTAPPGLYCPLPHVTHDVSPVVLVYVPGRHAEHVDSPPAAVTVPAAHAVHELLPADGEYWPDAQLLHWVEPPGLYCPAAHTVQDLPHTNAREMN